MHVTVVGAGALGRIYGVRLRADGAEVAFVVRPGRESETRALVLEQINGDKRRDELDRPNYVTSVPAHTDYVIVAVRSNQVAGVVPLLAAAPRAVAVVLTPMVPAAPPELARRIVAAMPGVAGYVDDRDIVRYFLTSVASTLLDDDGGDRRPALEDLARRLTRAGLTTRLERDVANANRATTTAFFPLIAAIDVGGGVDGALADKELYAVMLEAAKETDTLARKIGQVASWAGLLTRFVGPFTLRPAIALAKRVAPEAVRFVDKHFGEKLHGQHVAMGTAILEMAAAEGIAMPHFEKLMALVGARS